MKLHIGSLYQFLLNMQRKYTTPTEVSKNLIRIFKLIKLVVLKYLSWRVQEPSQNQLR